MSKKKEMKKTRKSRVKKATESEKKMIDEILGTQLSSYYKEVNARKKSLGDYVYVRTIYRNERGKIIKKDVAKKLIEKGIPVIKEHRYYLKVDLPEFNLKKGRQIKKSDLETVLNYVKEEVRKYNSALGVAYAQDIPLDDAMKLVEETLKAYEEGKISVNDVHDILSP